MIYPPELFLSRDLDQALEIVSGVKFATICLVEGGLADLVFAPFMVSRMAVTPLLQGHLAKTNPLFTLLRDKPRACRLVFHAADGYISPSIYAEKQRTGEVVPTWNYVAAQFCGTLEQVPQEELMDLLEHQVTVFETSAGSDWQLRDAPEDYRQLMVDAIFGIRFHAERWAVHKKLSQNKPGEQDTVRAWIQRAVPRHKTLSYWMEKSEER